MAGGVDLTGNIGVYRDPVTEGLDDPLTSAQVSAGMMFQLTG